MDPKARTGPGPFRVDQLHTGDRYELSHGHAIYCAPAGGDHARTAGLGFEVLSSDPLVDAAGVDAGFTTTPGTMRAPDVAIGNVPDRPGWVPGAPPLAVEYASRTQDEDELRERIADLFAMGTSLVWVVRLTTPRHVEVHTPAAAPVVVGPGGVLTAPGILRNPVPVEALWEREAAHEATLRNLLQRSGYESLDEVRDEGREAGHDAGRRASLVDILTARFGAVPEHAAARIAVADDATLRRWLLAALSSPDVDAALRG